MITVTQWHRVCCEWVTVGAALTPRDKNVSYSVIMSPQCRPHPLSPTHRFCSESLAFKGNL